MKIKKTIIALLAFLLFLGSVIGVLVATDVFVSSYTITFDVNGGELDGESKIEVKKGEKLTLPNATKEGFTLNGWYNDKELWTEEKAVKGNLKLTARWDEVSYIITFIVDGKSYYETVKHNEMPEFSLGEPVKPNTSTEEYVFAGWQPTIEKATKNTTYVAKFDTTIRKFNVNLSSNLSGGTILGQGKYEFGTNATISVTPKIGYTFLGWYYSDDTLFTTQESFSINNINKDYNLVAKFELIENTISYFNTKSATNTNPTKINITMNEIALSPLSLDGYNFVGWFTSLEGGQKVNSINTALLTDVILYARWELITYTINYNLSGGTNNVYNPSTYTIESPTISLAAPTKDEDNFLGWTGTGLSATTMVVIIPNGSFGNRTYNAVWSGGVKVITLIADDIELTDHSILANAGDAITLPIVDGKNYGMAGYIVSKWKNIYGEEVTLNSMPNENTTIYGSFEYFLGFGFMPYKEKFDAATSTSYFSPLNIDSFDELVALVEYSCFYNKSYIYFAPKYKSLTQDQLKTEISSALNKSKYPNTYSFSYYTYTDGKVGYLDLSSAGLEYENNLKTADQTKAYALDQPSYALSVKPNAVRVNNYEGFNINKVTTTIEVFSSNQLVYALEVGLRPIPVVGSNAETVYNKAKQILRNIISDDMTDIEKSRAIYEYISLNVQYDNYAVSAGVVSTNWMQYNSWYAEGALLNGIAVCDGISKAYLILSKIENIPTLRVVSDDHAWNKICIDGLWYGVDATHADTSDTANGIEVFTYTQFMFTDSYKTSLGQISTNYLEYQANTEYNYYDEVEFETEGGQIIDLVVASVDEYLILLEHIKDCATGMEQYTFEIIFSTEEFSSTYMFTILNASTYLRGSNTTDCGLTVYTYIIYAA